MPFSLTQRIKKLMKIGVVTDSNDSTSYPIIFVSYLGKTLARAVNFTPFGLWSRPLKGMMSILFNINGSESNKFALTNELKNRPVKNLKEGESVLGNLLSFVHFKEDGSVVFTIPIGKTLTINGNVIINGGVIVNGEITTENAGGILKVTVTEFELDGLMNSTGKITSQDIVEGSDLTNGSVPYTSHVHSDPQGGITGAPQ